MKLLLQRITFTSLAFFPLVAMAHPGHEHSHNSFISGFVHPFTGLDHLMMALAFGLHTSAGNGPDYSVYLPQ